MTTIYMKSDESNRPSDVSIFLQSLSRQQRSLLEAIMSDKSKLGDLELECGWSTSTAELAPITQPLKVSKMKASSIATAPVRQPIIKLDFTAADYMEALYCMRTFRVCYACIYEIEREGNPTKAKQFLEANRKKNPAHPIAYKKYLSDLKMQHGESVIRPSSATTSASAPVLTAPTSNPSGLQVFSMVDRIVAQQVKARQEQQQQSEGLGL